MKECKSRICMAIVAISRTLSRCNYPLSTSTFITPCSIFDIQFHWRCAINAWRSTYPKSHKFRGFGQNGIWLSGCDFLGQTRRESFDIGRREKKRRRRRLLNCCFAHVEEFHMPQTRLIIATLALACLLPHGTAFAADCDCVAFNAGCQAGDGLNQSCRHCEARRAGYPDQVACYARRDATPDYRGYYVGGGVAIGRGNRCPHEGTWGWDYVGRHFRRLVALTWWHSRRPCANREGSYTTD